MNMGRIATRSPTLSRSSPNLLVQGLNLDRHESFTRSVPNKYPRQCHVSVSSRRSRTESRLHNFQILSNMYIGEYESMGPQKHLNKCEANFAQNAAISKTGKKCCKCSVGHNLHPTVPQYCSKLGPSPSRNHFK